MKDVISVNPAGLRNERLNQLDGVRTVAILWVALFHYAVFWAPSGQGLALLPYGDALAWVPMAEVGYLGVYLFFVVSGFVISLSLSNSSSPREFIALRAIRLWPTLLICGSLTFALTQLFAPEPLKRSVAEYLISLTFVPPAHVGKLIGQSNLEWLDGAYWSLWTEVRFYAVAALLYFLNTTRFLILWFCFALVSSAIFLLGELHGSYFDAASRLLFAQFQPFFSAGIALAALRADGRSRLARALLFLGIAQAFLYAHLTSESGLTNSLLAGLVFVFALTIHASLGRSTFRLLASRPMVLCGYASYAYYLLHQNAGLALLEALAGKWSIPDVLTMVLIQCLLMVFSILLTTRIEAPLRRMLRNRVRNRKGDAGARDATRPQARR